MPLTVRFAPVFHRTISLFGKVFSGISAAMQPYLQLVQYSYPTTIHIGPGARKLLPERLRREKITAPLVVTDAGLAKLPIIDDLKSMLGDFNTSVYADVYGNPVQSQVLKGVQSYKDNHCDAIIGVGGGAALDVAKLIALMAHHPGDLFEYEDGKSLPVDQAIPFFAALPTTAGTGSEVGRSAVVSDDVTHVKKIIFSPRLLAKVIFADPELTLALPPQITAATGMDAITHLIESFLAQNLHPLCDGIALEGLRLASQALPTCIEFAKAQGAGTAEHVIARNMMLHAAFMGGVAFQKGLGVTHSCAHALSTVCDLHHGLANGIMLPFTMRFNQEVERERFARLTQTIGCQDLIEWIESLRRSIGIPARLSDVGVRPEHLAKLCDFAFKDSCHLNNPRPVSQEDFAHLFSEAL
jgi:alcohol dehydrogenase class IV